MKKKFLKIIAVFLAINIFFDAIYPTAALALTGGPKQPEVAGFTPVGTSEMVSTFTGDFNYNIPLMDVGGYPLNLSYQSGITMDQEASWVGLGWSLNPGVIDRGMRSLPDDFNGDEITKEFNVKANNTYGVKFSPAVKVTGKGIPNKNLKYGLGLTYNNYTGFAFSASMDLKLLESAKTKSTVSLGLTAGSETGVGISPSLSFTKNTEDKQFRDQDVTATVGLAYNSRAGLSNLTLSTNCNRDGKAYITKDVNVGMKRGMSGSDGASISFVSPTYMPPSGHSMLNLNMSLNATLGAEIFPTHPNGKLEGFYAGQYLMNKTETFPAYGYLNSQNAIQDKVLLDFNREKDGSFNERTPSLPLTNFTYDTYNVSGQGIGGMYRAHRSDIGVLYDSKVMNISAGVNFPGIEIGVANTAHSGINLSLNESNSTGGKWERNNEAAGLLAFKGGTGDPFYEAAYFKKAGETNAESDKEFFDAIGGYEPIRININHNLESAPTQPDYNEPSANMSKNSRASRARRNEVISLLSAWEAKSYGYIKTIESYQNNVFAVKGINEYKNIFQPQTDINRDDDFRKAHHTSQIATYRDDGAKYVYGIPAYNTKQDERTFAVQYIGDPNDLKADGTVPYYQGDDTKDNNNGLDHYFDRTVMPAYAHSYLLTEILSADYVDVTDNGPTDDDLGTYTKINYSRTTPDYKWRVPYALGRASYNEGLSSVPADVAGDDKGSYVYGEKELWYMHSIETKNYVAIFELGDRADGLGVQGEQGGYNSATSRKMKLLKKITLYSKQDLLKHKDILHADQDPTNDPTPLKTVNFEYDYSLCTGVDNNINAINHVQPGTTTLDANNFVNNGGKLTLKKVYFTYGISMKGKLSPYEFIYTGNSNQKYCLKGYDRWGNYKLNSIAEPAAEFPYTDQRPDYANDDATMWHMSSIQLPSGGVINVELEADDYAYVQDKRAMQMFKVVGVSGGNTAPTSLPSEEDKNKLYKDLISRNYLIFEIPYSNMDLSDMGKLFFREKDGTMIKDLYYRFRLDLGRFLGRGKFEYVSGYTKIAGEGNYGHFSDGGKEYGWVKIDEQSKILDKIDRPPAQVNPISQAGWCFTKMNLPVLAYNKPTVADGKLLQIVKSIASTLKGLTTVFNGFYNQMRLEGMSQVFDPAKSFIRLYNPVNAKKGGGCRVKKIRLSDNWNALTSQESTEYGQEYNYTMSDEYGQKISSGVAAYEPLLGGDENPFRQPVPYEIQHLFAANDEFYQEEPFGESFFPGPTVGYSKVTIRNLQYTAVKRHATGYVVNEFYTAKDFPTIAKRTTIDAKRVKPNPILKLLKIKARDLMTATQGFCIELNNMHGQPKGTYVYAEGKDKPISGVKYIYKTSVKSIGKPDYIDDPIEVGSLDNQV
jgi:hypothetical protein